LEARSGICGLISSLKGGVRRVIYENQKNTMQKKDYIDRTIIKLSRKYSKDELVAALNKQLSQKDAEIGKLNAEIDHLENNEEILQKEITTLKNKLKIHEGIREYAKIEARKEELYKLQVAENKKIRKELKELRMKYNDLFAKLIYLKHKQ